MTVNYGQLLQRLVVGYLLLTTVVRASPSDGDDGSSRVKYTTDLLDDSTDNTADSTWVFQGCHILLFEKKMLFKTALFSIRSYVVKNCNHAVVVVLYSC